MSSDSHGDRDNSSDIGSHPVSKDKVTKPTQNTGNSERTKNTGRNRAQLQPIRFDPNRAFRENTYYYGVAKKFRLAKYAALFTAILFVALMLFLFPHDITAENFRYLMRDLNINGITVRGDYQTLVYNGGSDTRFAVYRGNIAVVNAGSTALYNGAGVATYSIANAYYRPTLLTGKRYMLVYDRFDTSNSYAVYNAFDEVISENFDNPILTAAISDAGDYLIITSDKQNRSLLYWYDSSCRMAVKNKLDAYIVSAALAPNGKEAVVASIIDQDASLLAHISVYSQNSENAVCSIDIQDAVPMDVAYLDNGNIGALFTDRYTVYSSTLSEIGTFVFDDTNHATAYLGERYLCFVHNLGTVGNDKEAILIDSDGNAVITCPEQGELRCIRVYGENAYLLFEDHVSKIQPKDGTVYRVPVSPNGMDILSVDDTVTLVCYPGNAVPVSFT